MIEERQLLETIADEHPRPLVFATVSGAHLYGFPSADSDFDLRGVHLMDTREVLGLGEPTETIDRSGIREGREIDLVTHDARKFFRLMLKRNGYVLEQLFSPLVVRTSPEHEELLELGRGCVTRGHVHHYIGFARNQWDLFRKEPEPRVKPLLYVYRVLLTGIHLMRTGVVEANLLRLNEDARLPYINDLVRQKVEGPEAARIAGADLNFHESEFERLLGELGRAGEASELPDQPTPRAKLDALLDQTRLKQLRETWLFAATTNCPPCAEPSKYALKLQARTFSRQLTDGNASYIDSPT